MTPIHLPEQNRFELIVDDCTAYVEYILAPSYIDIIHTVVPKAIEGRGVASLLVSAVYKYGETLNLQAKASCSYAAVWLKRHNK